MTVLTGDERDRVVQIIEYITRYKTSATVGDIKKKFNLTKEEYDMCMDLAMPSIRHSNTSRFFIQAFRHLTWQIEVYLLGLKRMDEGLDEKPEVPELYSKTVDYMRQILEEAEIRWVKSKEIYDTSVIKTWEIKDDTGKEAV